MKKAKKIGLLVVLVFAAMCFFTTQASAAWYTASIVVVGSGSADMYIQLTDTAASPAFTKTWFTLAGDNANQMLAAALTAASLGKDVFVNCADTAQFSDITGLFVSM
jgi:hypothetical protein